MGRFIHPAIFTVNSSTEKIVKIDLKKEENSISPDDLHLGVGTRAINKCTTTQVLEVRKIKENAWKFLIHLVEKLKERSSYVTNTHNIYIFHQTR